MGGRGKDQGSMASLMIIFTFESCVYACMWFFGLSE